LTGTIGGFEMSERATKLAERITGYIALPDGAEPDDSSGSPTEYIARLIDEAFPTPPDDVAGRIKELRELLGNLPSADYEAGIAIVESLSRERAVLMECLSAATKEKRESAHRALTDACHIVWYHKSLEHEGCERTPHFWSIPVDKDRDVDVRIGDMLNVFDAALALIEGEKEKG
jgi:hypothetical protein